MPETETGAAGPGDDATGAADPRPLGEAATLAEAEALLQDDRRSWPEEAVAALAARLNPPSAAAADLAIALFGAGRHGAAAAFAAPLLGSGRIAPHDAIRLSKAAAPAGAERQEAVLTAALEGRDNAFLRIERAKLHRAARRLERAVADSGAAVRLAPGNAAIACENVWTLLAAGDPDGGYRAARAGLEAQPDDPRLIRALAVAEGARGHLDEAAAILRASLEAGTADAETAPALRRVTEQRFRLRHAALAGDRSVPVTAAAAAGLADEAAALEGADPDALRDARAALARLDAYRALPAAERDALFDPGFYALQLDGGEAVPGGTAEDAMAHYALRGAARRLSPSPFFEPWTALDALGAGAEEADALLAHLRDGAGRGLAFHPLIPAGGPGLRAIAEVAEGLPDRRVLAAAVLAAPARRMARRAAATPALAEALALLFDPRHYAAQLAARGVEVPPDGLLAHFAREGWRAGLDPHPLFRTAHYLEREPTAAAPGLDPLTHYVERGGSDAATHPLIAANIAALRAALPAGAPLLTGYLALPVGERPGFVRFFDAAYVRIEHPEVDWTLADPLLHLLSVGDRQGWSPHPAMDPAWLRAGTIGPLDPLRPVSVLEAFARHPEPRPAPFALFDPAHYAAAHPDLAGLCAASHYLSHGMWENRRPNRLLFAAYVMARESDLSFASRPPVWAYLARRRNRRRRILFVGHDATRTGAPGILYRLVEHMAAHDDVECVTVLDGGGPLVEEFAAHALTLVKEGNRFALHGGTVSAEAFEAELDALMRLLADNPPEIAVLNSAEIRDYAPYFAARGIPVVSLVHEIAGIYPAGELEALAALSSRIVFPARFVERAFDRAYRPDPARVVVLPQGLLRDGFGDRPRGDRIEVFGAAGIEVEEGDVIALGCGTIDGRKGFDLFVRTARLVRERRPEGRIRFVWIGGRRGWRMHGGATYDSVGHWASWENLREEDAELIHVVPEVRDTEAYFVNADLFLMTSRADPFPCVVHEAMASRLPVLCFDGTGGAPEAIRDDAGLVLPYLDCEALADGVVALAEDAGRRRAMGEAGRARVKGEYVFSDYAERVKALLLEELGAGPDHYGAARPTRGSRGRVYLGVPGWAPGPGAALTEALAGRLAAAGYEAEILITRGRFGGPGRGTSAAPYLPHRAEALPDAPYRMLQPATANPRDSLVLARNFLADRAPCVFLPGEDPGLMALAAELPPGVAVLGTVASDEEETLGHAYRQGVFLDRIVASSDRIAARLLALNPGFGPRLEVIRDGLEPPPESEVEAAIAARAATGPRIRLVHPGEAAGAGAGIAELCRLAEVMALKGLAFELAILGGEAEIEPHRRRLRPLLRAGLVTLPGRPDREAVARLLAGAHAVLALSGTREAALGAVAGMLAGCVPVVRTGSGGLSELLRHGEDGFTVPRGRIEAVAALMERIAGDPAGRERLMRAARATALREGLTAEAAGRRHDALIARMLAEIGEGALPRRSFREAG